MKTSTLLFRSLAIIIVIAGGAHAFNSMQGDNDGTNKTTSIQYQYDDQKLSNISMDKKDDYEYILGKWQVNYDSKDFKGVIVYNLEKEKEGVVGYMDEYKNLDGYGEKAEKKKILSISKFNGKKGVGIYTVDYEGSTYEVNCEIWMIDDSTFTLYYDYYGYSGEEIWKRIEQ